MSTIPVSLAESYAWRSGVDRIRACLFCVHSNGDEIPIERRCRCPDVSGSPNRTTDCHVARETFGACGIEAKFLKLRGE